MSQPTPAATQAAPAPAPAPPAAPERSAARLAEFGAHDVPSTDILFGRWLFLGCACTLAVAVVAFLAFVGAVAWGVATQ